MLRQSGHGVRGVTAVWLPVYRARMPPPGADAHNEQPEARNYSEHGQTRTIFHRKVEPTGNERRRLINISNCLSRLLLA